MPQSSVEPDFYASISTLSATIMPDKQGAKRHWGSHPYFTRRAWNVVQAYIRNYCREGEVVCDPFGGSGVTAVEALVCGRKAIHCDINPLANFICQELAISPISLKELRQAFLQIEVQCKQKIEKVYKLKEKDLKSLRIPFWYPKNIRLPKNADVEFIEELFTKRQLFSLALLLHHINNIKSVETRNLMRFTFSATLNKTNLTFSSTHGRLASRGNSGIMHRYRYWIPPETLDLNVWEQFEQKFQNTCKVKEETNHVIGHKFKDNLSVYDTSATDLTKVVRAESVDYIYTDPPYGAHIAYLDLSTMWNSWLQFPVKDSVKKKEVIEGGDLNKTKQEYIDLLEDSIGQMFTVLKFNRWMSIVFSHKDPAYWDAIIKSAQRAGFEYVNTAVQPSTTPSLHKRQNPLKVLSGELVLNFRKVSSPKAIAVGKMGIDVVQLIKEVAEHTIVMVGGATTEQIYNALIPKLLENGLLGEMKKELDDVTPLLRQEFEFSETDAIWRIRPNSKLGSFIPLEERIRFYLIDYLQRIERKGELATFDDIIQHVMPMLINGTTPENQTILKVLERIAHSPDGLHWQLGGGPGSQIELNLDDRLGPIVELPEIRFTKDPDEIEHNSIIYALSQLALCVGLKPYIGKKERRTELWNGQSLSECSMPELPKDMELNDWQRNKIEQIDIIWFTKEGQPVFAFEVETSTPITTGIDRFMEFLKIFPQLAKHIVLVIPPKRLLKIDQLLGKSHYIGHPLYMETKLMYCFTNRIAELYQKAASQKYKLTDQALIQSVISVLVPPKQ
jgi:DNA modification methylase